MNCNNSKNESQQRGGVIYLITNNLNGKVYVGQTIQRLGVRLWRHKNDGKPGIGKAIQKYGWENFSAEILEICSIDMIDLREKFWIKVYDCIAPNGYNLTDGGNGRRVVSDETRKKLSESHLGKPAYWKGKKFSEEHKANLSKSHKGKKMLDEQRAKISKSLKGKMSGEKNPMYGKTPHNKGQSMSDEQRLKISDTLKLKGIKPPSRKGETSPMKGRHHSAEARARMSATKKAQNAKKKLEKNNFVEGRLFND